MTCSSIQAPFHKVSNFLSWLPFVTRKSNDNPLEDEDVSLHETKVEIGEDYCPLCEIDLTDTKALQKSNKYCIRIAKLLENPRSRFHERDFYRYDDTGLLYHINWENGKDYKAMDIPKTLIKTVLQEMHDHFGHFSIRKTYSLIKRCYYWPKMIKHILCHVDSCSLCQREKMQADKYQLKTLEILGRAFTKVSADLILELPTCHYNNKNILVMVDHLTGRPIAKPIPDKEAMTVANAIFKKLILEQGTSEVLLSSNGKEFTMTLWPMCVRSSILNIT